MKGVAAQDGRDQEMGAAEKEQEAGGWTEHKKGGDSAGAVGAGAVVWMPEGLQVELTCAVRSAAAQPFHEKFLKGAGTQPVALALLE